MATVLPVPKTCAHSLKNRSRCDGIRLMSGALRLPANLLLVGLNCVSGLL